MSCLLRQEGDEKWINYNTPQRPYRRAADSGRAARIQADPAGRRPARIQRRPGCIGPRPQLSDGRHSDRNGRRLISIRREHRALGGQMPEQPHSGQIWQLRVRPDARGRPVGCEA